VRREFLGYGVFLNSIVLVQSQSAPNSKDGVKA